MNIKFNIIFFFNKNFKGKLYLFFFGDGFKYYKKINQTNKENKEHWIIPRHTGAKYTLEVNIYELLALD